MISREESRQDIDFLLSRKRTLFNGINKLLVDNAPNCEVLISVLEDELAGIDIVDLNCRAV